MSKRVWITVGLLLAASGLAARTVRADDVLYRYEGNVIPTDPSEGWLLFDPCDPPCSESIENGHLVFRWTQAANIVNYTKVITEPPTPEYGSLWVEWRFRSNHPLGPIFTGCDGIMVVDFSQISDLLNMYGDAAISNSGAYWVDDLELNKFHLYRFESADGAAFWISVNGQKFFPGLDNHSNGWSFLQLAGRGGCTSDQIPDMVNEWDYVRYGTIGFGEQIVSVDPPPGQLGPGGYTSFTTFRVTFDAANFVYIDDISVSVTGGTAPIVTATRRRETDDVDTVEIVLDRPLPNNQRTRFTFTDAAGTQHIDYDFREPVPPVPTLGTAGALLTASAILLAGLLALRRRISTGGG